MGQFGHADERKRCRFSRFQHHRIAHGQGRAQLPSANHQREIPRDDGPDHAHRLFVDHAQHVARRRSDLAIDLVQRFRVIPDGARSRARLGLERHTDLGAIVAHAQNGQLQRMGLNQFRPFQHDFLACHGGLSGPTPIFERRSGRGDGRVHVLRGALGHLGQLCPVDG